MLAPLFQYHPNPRVIFDDKIKGFLHDDDFCDNISNTNTPLFNDEPFNDIAMAFCPLNRRFFLPNKARVWRNSLMPSEFIISSRRVDYIEIEIDSSEFINTLESGPFPFLSIGVRTDDGIPHGNVQGWDNQGSAFHSDDSFIHLGPHRHGRVVKNRQQLFSNCPNESDNVYYSFDDEEALFSELNETDNAELSINMFPGSDKTRRVFGVGLLFSLVESNPTQDTVSSFRHPLSLGHASDHTYCFLYDEEIQWLASEKNAGDRGELFRTKNIWEVRRDLVKGSDNQIRKNIIARDFYTLDGKFLGFGKQYEYKDFHNLIPVLSYEGRIRGKVRDGLKIPFVFPIDAVFPPLMRKIEFIYRMGKTTEEMVISNPLFAIETEDTPSQLPLSFNF